MNVKQLSIIYPKYLREARALTTCLCAVLSENETDIRVSILSLLNNLLVSNTDDMQVEDMVPLVSSALRAAAQKYDLHLAVEEIPAPVQYPVTDSVFQLEQDYTAEFERLRALAGLDKNYRVIDVVLTAEENVHGVLNGHSIPYCSPEGNLRCTEHCLFCQQLSQCPFIP